MAAPTNQAMRALCARGTSEVAAGQFMHGVLRASTAAELSAPSSSAPQHAVPFPSSSRQQQQQQQLPAAGPCSTSGRGLLTLGSCSSSRSMWASWQQQQFRGMAKKIQVEYHPVVEPAHDRYTTEPTNYIQLLGALTSAADLKRLQHLVAAFGPQMDSLHAVAALVRLPKVAAYRPKDMVDASADVPDGLGLPQSASLRPAASARPRLGYLTAAEALGRQLLADALLAPGVAEQLGAREAAHVIWSLGKLSKLGVYIEDELLAAAVERLTAEGGAVMTVLAGQAKGADVAQLVKGLTLLQQYTGVAAPAAAVEALTAAATANASSFSASEVQTTAWGLATLGVRSTPLYDALAARAVRRPRDFKPAGIAGTLWALATAAGGTLTAPQRQAFEVLSAGLGPQAVLVTPKDCALLAQAAAAAGAGALPAEVLTLVANLAARRLEAFGPSDIAALLSSFGKLGFAHGPLLQAFVSSVVAERDIHPNLHPAAAGGILEGLAALGPLGSGGDAVTAAARVAGALMDHRGQPSARLARAGVDEVAAALSGLAAVHAAAPGGIETLVLPDHQYPMRDAAAKRVGRALPALLVAQLEAQLLPGSAPVAPAPLVRALRALQQLASAQQQQPVQLAAAVAQHVRGVLLPQGLVQVPEALQLMQLCTDMGVADRELARAVGTAFTSGGSSSQLAAADVAALVAASDAAGTLEAPLAHAAAQQLLAEAPSAPLPAATAAACIKALSAAADAGAPAAAAAQGSAPAQAPAGGLSAAQVKDVRAAVALLRQLQAQ